MQPNYKNDTLGALGPLPEALGTSTVRIPRQKANTKMATKKKAKKKKAAAPLSGADRSKAIAKTWKDPAVAAARATHHGVRVGKETYRSVKAAFTALGLPLGRRGPFRSLLKAQGIGGALVFEHDGGKVKFTLIELPRASGDKPAPKAKKKAAAPKAKKKAAARVRKPKASEAPAVETAEQAAT